MAIVKKPIGIDVLQAARERIRYTFDHFEAIYVSFSAGKDSSVMMHLVMDEARRRGRRVGILLIDLEAQYQLTIKHAEEMMQMYADCIDPYWVCLPIKLRNAVSNYQPVWCAWDPDKKADWVRSPPKGAITDPDFFDFFEDRMEFEEFIDEFGHWYGDGEATACFVGIRTTESLNRWRALTGDHHRFGDRKWTTWKGRALYNAYPIYDWRTEDIWTFYGKTGLPHNRVYDLMHRAGVPLHHQRICQPYGDDQRRGHGPDVDRGFRLELAALREYRLCRGFRFLGILLPSRPALLAIRSETTR